MNKRNRQASKEKSRTYVLKLLCLRSLASLLVLLWISAPTSWAEIYIDSTDESDSIHVVPDGERKQITIETSEDDNERITVRSPHPKAQNSPQPLIIVPEIHVDGHAPHRRPDTNPLHAPRHHHGAPQHDLR